MSNGVLPAPEKLDGTKSCEMAALLVTLGFVPVDNCMTVARGDGIPGGRLGYWQFLPDHPAKKYSLAVALKHGLNAWQAGLDKTARWWGGIKRGELPPVYREQAYIAAAFHNKRLLVESILQGTRLKLERADYLYIFRRENAAPMPEMPGKEAVRDFMAAGTRNTELAAALATLGFAPMGVSAGTSGTAITHEARGVTWMLPDTSADGRWSLHERMARYEDAAWCAREDNTDPIACMSDAFWNLNQLRRALDNARVLIRVQNGNRSILLPNDAPDSVKKRAADFLKGH